MKRIIFPVTNRVHEARQKLLLEELRRYFDVDVFRPRIETRGDLETYAILAAVEFKNYIAGKSYDLALIRADRFELLLISGLCAYRGIPIAHIEGGAESGKNVIDTRVRNSITSLADFHFVTDELARKRVIALGATEVFNVGSLDVSFAARIMETKPEPVVRGNYFLLLHHAIPNEDTAKVVDSLRDFGVGVVGVESNSDYKSSLMAEKFSPEDFISLIYHARCFIGNSSAICKEASILGTPCVLVGSRQDGRVIGKNVLRVSHKKREIQMAVKRQLCHGRYRPDGIYYKKDAEKQMTKILRKFV